MVAEETQQAPNPETPALAAEPQSTELRPTHEDIVSLAYALWQQRGCPEGSPEEDWFRAEQELAARLGA